MSAKQVVARVYEPFAGGKIHDQAILGIWFFVIGMPLQGLGPIRYLFVLYFLMFFLFDTRNLVNGIARAWWLVPFQAIAFLSFFWSPYASDAMRSSVIMILSAIIIVIVAARFTPQQILRCTMISCWAVMFYVVSQAVPISQGGVFGSKNYAALFLLIGFILSFAAALNPDEFKWVRGLALLMAPVFAWLVVSANSTTALLMMMISATAVVVMRLFFIDARRVRNLFSLMLVFGFAAILLAIYVVLVFVDQQVLNSFLGAFGKDTTFTGRADLWSEAMNQISMRPYLGVGLEGFWQYDVGAAQTLNENDYKAFGTKLTFHNVHLEVLVHLGVVGYVCFILSILGVIWFTVQNLLKHGDMAAITFVAAILVGLISSFVESSLTSGFNVQSSLFFVAGAVYARGDRRKFLGSLVATDSELESVPQIGPGNMRLVKPAS